ncbi:MAG TPA: prepilin-type N-terminal cleavage/methylation domain-containing protein [Acidimicrobiales bacterium]|nr:prepilin-type N-terminal cleavage/methylation domain-containing protein [Acidimicrobiales bacterium]
MRRDDDGFTMIELAVTMLLLSIVSAMLYGFLNSTSSATARISLHTRAQRDAELAMRTITQDLRAASPITSAPCGSYANCIAFELQRASATGHDCEKTVIGYALASGTLRRSLTENTWSGSACTVTRSVTNLPLLVSVVNATVTPTVPMLVYYDNKGVLLDPATQATTLVKKPAQGGTATIKVNFVVQYKSDAPPLKLTGLAALRNSR